MNLRFAFYRITLYTVKKGVGSMIKNIIFDLGNVIVRWNPKYIVAHYTNDEIMQDKLITNLFASSHWLSFDEGSLTREQVIRNVKQTLPEEYHQMVHDMVHYWHKHAPPIAGMEELAKELKKAGYKIYLLSNTNIHFDEYKDTIPALQYFDGYYISAQAKLMKPHKEIYLDFLKTFALTASECIFIDDIEANIASAIEVGIDGYHFDGDVGKLRKYIAERTSIQA